MLRLSRDELDRNGQSCDAGLKKYREERICEGQTRIRDKLSACRVSSSEGCDNRSIYRQQGHGL